MAAINVTSGNGDTNKVSGARVAVRNASGIPYIVVENVSDSSIDVYKGNATTPASFAEQDVINKPSGTVYTGISAAIDSTGIIHIAYLSHNAKVSELRYVTFNTNTNLFAGDAQLVSDLGNDATGFVLTSAIAIDSSDKPHIAYTSMGGKDGTDIKYANKTGVSWATEIEVEGDTNGNICSYPDICIDIDNKPCISYFNETDNDVATAQGDANDAATFTLQDVDTDGSQTAGERSTSICVDSSGNHYVAYEDHGDGFIYLIKHSYGVAWTTWGTRATGSDAGINPSVVADQLDIYIFYEDPASHDIYYEKVTDGTTWAGDNLLEEDTYNTVKAKWALWIDNDSEGPITNLWTKTGNSLTIAGTFYPALAMLSSTRVAYIDSVNEKLETYDWDETDWTKTGNSLTITGAGSPALAALSSTRVAYIDSTNDKLETYDWNGTDWTKTGNSLTITGAGVPALAMLSSTRVAYIDSVNSKLETYDWDGTDWTKTGNSLTMSGAIPALAMLSSARVAYIDDTNEKLETYDWDGTDWTKTGNSLTITGASVPALAMLSSTRVAYIDGTNDKLETYDWNVRISSTELDYVFIDETATPDVLWNKLVLAAGIEHTQSCSDSIAMSMTISQNNIIKKILSISIAETTSSLTAFSLSDSETLDAVITIANDNNIPFAETIQLLESFVKELDVSLAEALVFVEDISKLVTFNKLVSQSLIITEELTKTQQLIFQLFVDLFEDSSREIGSQVDISELVIIVENISNTFNISKSEAFTLIDSIITVLNANRVHSDSLELIDILQNEINLSKQETVVFVELLINLNSKTFAEILSLSEIFIKSFNLSTSSAITLIDSFAKQSSYSTRFSEILELIENMQQLYGLSKIEARNIIALMSSVSGTSQNINEILQIEEISTKIAEVKKQEMLELIDTLQIDIGLSTQEVLLIIDSILMIKTTSQEVSDTLPIDAIIIKYFGITKDDIIELIDVRSAQSAYSKELSTILQLAERYYSLYNLTNDEIVNILDSMSSVAGSTFALDDNINIISEIVKSTHLSKQEALTIVDSLARYLEYFKIFAKELQLIDNLQKMYELSTQETTQLIDNMTSVAGSTFALDDVVQIASDKTLQDTILKQETLDITESSSMLIQFTRIFSDILTLLEDKQLTQSISRDDIIILIDSYQAIAGTGTSLADTLSIAASYTKLIDRHTNETLELVETFVKQLDTLYQDSFTIVDNIIHTSSLINSETINLDESVIKNVVLTKSSSFSIIEISSIFSSFAEKLSELLERSEDKIFVQDKITTLQDEIIIAEIIKKVIILPIHSSIVILDSASARLGGQIINISDNINLTETHSSKYIAIIVDNVTMLESLIATREIFKIESDSIDLLDFLKSSSEVTLDVLVALIDSNSTLKKGPLNDIAIVRTNQHKTILNTTKTRTILVADKTRTILLTKE